ncbi:MAG: creatininase family protein [Phycisphaerae bacterium]|nr:creatininase family protein [Phycisphaerae bacterium]
MKWEELTAPDFARAVEDTGGVCIIAVGSLEKHFDHLPLGTDYMNGHMLCCLAAEQEPVVVFPPYYFGQTHESRPFPGTIALPATMTLELLMAVFDEISRNGFDKIIVYNAHGGNWALLNYIRQVQLAERRSYALYMHNHLHPTKQRLKEWQAALKTDIHGHACECETSITLANFPPLVKMDELKGRKTEPLDRFAHLRPGDMVADWYSDYPDHYAGDATAATAAKGETLRDLQVGALADFIRAVKQDTAVHSVLNDFYDRCDELGKK